MDSNDAAVSRGHLSKFASITATFELYLLFGCGMRHRERTILWPDDVNADRGEHLDLGRPMGEIRLCIDPFEKMSNLDINNLQPSLKLVR
jgi:hypothetical protein